MKKLLKLLQRSSVLATRPLKLGVKETKPDAKRSERIGNYT